MLRKLFVQNYALIDKLELRFDKGLTIVTGETGAGKSILLGALSLLLGQRADSSALLDKNVKCIIEGEFEADKKDILSFFTDHDLDFHQPLVIRREINPEGKSRAFINDTPVNLNQLKELSSMLVDIHSQHETLMLNTSGFQLSMVDAFAGHVDKVEEYKAGFFSYRKILQEVDKLIESEKKSNEETDYLNFQFNELEQAGLLDDEQEKLEAELQLLNHAEEIKTGLAGIVDAIQNNEENASGQISSIQARLGVLVKYDSRIQQLNDRMKSLHIELKDIGEEIEQVNGEVTYDPARIEWIQDRLNMVYHLQQKHRVNTIRQLLEIKNELSTKLSSFQSLSEKLDKLKKECEFMKEEVLAKAKSISQSRNNIIPKIEKELKILLGEVALPHAVLKVENNPVKDDALNENGIDVIRFLFSANKGIAYQDISKVASGGELSRLMLCLKSSIARLIKLPTMIFDEIDTGVSGETAIKTGNLLRDLARQHQVIAITHLPQIAGRGEAHYFVYKEIAGKRTFTRVRKLTGEERIVEIAKMLSGEKPSAIAVENAKELLKHH